MKLLSEVASEPVWVQQQRATLRLLMLSTPVAPLGSGLGGGVELTITNLAQVLVQRGHDVAIAAPAGSILPEQVSSDVKLIQVPGACQTTAQTVCHTQGRSAPVTTSAVLANTWAIVRQLQTHYDLFVNFAYDWLPLYLTPFLTTPVAHFVTMGSLSDAMDKAIAQLSLQCPGTLGAYTRSQANTFSGDQGTADIVWEILGSAIDITQYHYCDGKTSSLQRRAHRGLAWVGRISPEKGLEDAVAAAIRSRSPLNIFGKLEDLDYWQQIQAQIQQNLGHEELIRYCGFLPTAQLQQALSQCQALLMTPRWVEAFGMVAIEALACGVPVLAYRQGGPAEIVRSGETGYLVEPGDVEALVEAITKIGSIDRQCCRRQAESMYSLEAWGSRFERWFYKIVSGRVASSRVTSISGCEPSLTPDSSRGL